MRPSSCFVLLVACGAVVGAAIAGCGSWDLSGLGEHACTTPPPVEHGHYVDRSEGDQCRSVLICDDGWRSCGKDCDTDVVNDPASCGECLGACPAGGTCAYGSCLPVDHLGDVGGTIVLGKDRLFFASPYDSNANWFVMPKTGGKTAAFQAEVRSFAADGDEAYWIPKGEHEATVFAARPESAPRVVLEHLAFDAAQLTLGRSDLWWVEGVFPTEGVADGGVADGGAADSGRDELLGDASASQVLRRAPRDGGPAVTAAPIADAVPLSPILTVGDDVFFADENRIVVLRAGATKPTLLATEPTAAIFGMTADDRFLYWVGGDLVHRIPLEGGTATDFAPAPGFGVVAHRGEVFLPTGDALWRYDTNGGRKLLAGGLGSIVGLAVDDSGIYWSNAKGIFHMAR